MKTWHREWRREGKKKTFRTTVISRMFHIGVEGLSQALGQLGKCKIMILLKFLFCVCTFIIIILVVIIVFSL